MESWNDMPQPEDEALSTETKSSQGLTAWLLDLLETILLAVVLFVGINLVSARIRVESISMEPTLIPGEFVIVNKLAYRFGEMHRGDVVVFYYPRDPSQRYIKRIIGLPGDEVTVSGGRVFINGEALNEPYLNAPPTYMGTWQVPQDGIFVLGDNRNRSADSHVWGMVPLDYIIGKAIFVYWPLDRFGPVPGHPSF
ncbi:MAG: signal peptidase I [Anaerolineae bacterium]|nr:MAG: signal peptidase I [Anaerolineae bacterium]